MVNTSPAEYESLRDTAARIGYSVDTLRQKITAGELRAYRLSDKPGGAIRVRRADVDAMMTPVIPDAVYAGR